MLLPDGTTIDDTQAAQLVQLLKDDWLARAETYSSGGTRWRDTKRAVYRGCGFVFGEVEIPPDVSAESGGGVTRMPDRIAAAALLNGVER
jgi:hypothetical protein